MLASKTLTPSYTRTREPRSTRSIRDRPRPYTRPDARSYSSLPRPPTHPTPRRDRARRAKQPPHRIWAAAPCSTLVTIRPPVVRARVGARGTDHGHFPTYCLLI